METNFIPFNLAVLCFLLINVYGGNNPMETNRKEMLEIGIGGGGGGGGGSGGVGTNCPPPPPPPPPPPAPVYLPPPPPPLPPAPPLQKPSKPPLSLQPLFGESQIIKKLKGDVIDDPNHITKTWKGGNVCKYKGFLCTPSPRNKSRRIIASFDINGQNVKFKSLRYLGGLKDLMIIHVNSNRFMGTIPKSISKLRYLYELDVSNNLLSGPFPIYATKMPQLVFLDIRFNNFAGFVPPELFFIGHKVLFLNNNNFTEQIPDTLGSSPVAYLTLANNRFIGGIPRTIRNMSETLFEVLFLNNNLSGCLPYEIGFLKEATVFDAGFNQLTGPIPDSFGCLRLMELLNFAGNLLYGQIPEVVCALSKLTNLSLSDNYFNAAGPLCKRLANKGLLDDRKNCIPGRPKQRLPKECDEFYSKPKHCLSKPSYIPCQLPRFPRPPPPAVHATPPPSYSALSPFYIKSKPGA